MKVGGVLAVQRKVLSRAVARSTGTAPQHMARIAERPARPVVGFRTIDMEEELSRVFGEYKVDMVSEEYLNRRLRKHILASAEVQCAAS